MGGRARALDGDTIGWGGGRRQLDEGGEALEEREGEALEEGGCGGCSGWQGC